MLYDLLILLCECQLWLMLWVLFWIAWKMIGSSMMTVVMVLLSESCLIPMFLFTCIVIVGCKFYFASYKNGVSFLYVSL